MPLNKILQCEVQEGQTVSPKTVLFIVYIEEQVIKKRNFPSQTIRKYSWSLREYGERELNTTEITNFFKKNLMKYEPASLQFHRCALISYAKFKKVEIEVSELTNIRHCDFQGGSLRIHGKGNKVRTRKAGINKQISPHTFRRSLATNSNNKEVRLTTIQKALGHSRLDTTARYIHNSYEEIYQDYSKL
ncbi:4748_t:CDS:2 [Funneliformis geosporum]|uniref:4748_t:CDS:1 n=1 Tax=Funneliformis geosporum TaxID=1117311 RepID=A0A9W4WVR6_9GLOM|nr:4748_t:CDS:2 [Funneliformis geosporum]